MFGKSLRDITDILLQIYSNNTKHNGLGTYCIKDGAVHYLSNKYPLPVKAKI